MNKTKHSFKNDYSELVHPEVLEAFSSIGEVQFDGYGLDHLCERAAELIKAKLSAPSIDVHFVSGGTQANMIVISSMLRPYEAVIAPDTGHVSMFEAGAIEASGHKVCTVKEKMGKLDVDDIKAVTGAHLDEHMVKPRLVYISQSTEHGTVYTKSELTAISNHCRENGLYLYIDGARLGTAINSPVCDMTYADIAELADALTIGGAKNGALFGEAIVICNDELKSDFRYYLKQRGALIAKGAALGVQFEALFRDGLYDKLARRSNAMASRLAAGIGKLGYELQYPIETNQVFPILPAGAVEKLHRFYKFHDWIKLGGMTAVRLVTSWATPESAVDEFITDLKSI